MTQISYYYYIVKYSNASLPHEKQLALVVIVIIQFGKTKDPYWFEVLFIFVYNLSGVGRQSQYYFYNMSCAVQRLIRGRQL